MIKYRKAIIPHFLFIWEPDFPKECYMSKKNEQIFDHMPS